MSRYPIVDSDFHEFTPVNILADVLAAKGLLYAKIELRESYMSLRSPDLKG